MPRRPRILRPIPGCPELTTRAIPPSWRRTIRGWLFCRDQPARASVCRFCSVWLLATVEYLEVG
jgi:hypothetical protein